MGITMETKIPEQTKQVDPKQLEALRDACKNYATQIGGGFVRNDAEHWIFEAAIELVYGKDIWEWMNRKCRIKGGNINIPKK
jgi:hypothetical protein